MSTAMDDGDAGNLRDVSTPAACRLGPEGRWFKSSRPDFLPDATAVSELGVYTGDDGRADTSS
jgi:hypothetical protein